MEKVNVCFKTIQYGKFKGDVIAVLVDGLTNGMVDTFVLLEGHSIADVSWIQSQTRNSNREEYLSTYNNMVNAYGYKINVVDKIRRK